MLFKLLIAGLACLGANATPALDPVDDLYALLADKSALIDDKAPLHLLLPRHPPDHVPHDHSHLRLHTTKHLFFGQEHPKNPMKWDSRYASAQTTFKHPAVVLDHSSHTITTLKGDMMEVQFSNWSPYATARADWTDAGLPFLLVTTVGSKDDHFVYYLTDWVDCIDAALVCNLGVALSELENVGDEFTLEFGHWSDLGKRDFVPPSVPTAPPIPDRTPAVPTEPASPIASFDIALDESAGFYEWSPETFAEDLNDFADGITDFDYDHYNSSAVDVGGIYEIDGSTKGDYILETTESDYDIMKLRKRLVLRQRQTQKRGFFSNIGSKIVGVGKTIVNNVKPAVINTGDKIVGAFQSVKDPLFASIDKVKSWVDGTPRIWETQNNFTFPKPDDKRQISQGVFGKQDKSFYSAIQLFEESRGGASAKVYCLDCQVAAGLRVRGTIGYKWGSGLTQCSVGIHGNFRASMNLGIVAQYQFSYKQQQRMFAGGIPGLSVPPFFTLGPMATADIAATFDLSLAGAIMTGAEVILNDVNVVIDLLDTGKSRKPVFTPVIKPIGAVSGAVSARFSMSMRIGLSCGLDIADGRAKAIVSLISEPGVEAIASGAAMASLTGGVNTATDGCSGIKLDYGVHHSLYADAQVRLVFKNYDKKFPLADDFRQKFSTACLGRRTKRQIDDSAYDLYEDFSAPTLELDMNEGQDLYLSEFSNHSYHVPSAVEAFIAQPPNQPSNVQFLDATIDETAFNYSAVVETSLDWVLTSTTEGNLALQPSSDDLNAANLFAYYNGVLVGDAFGRILVYYDGEMVRYNASRIRMVLPERIPRSSKVIGLWPIDIGETPQIAPGMDTQLLVAIDSSARSYYPVLCNFVGDLFASKMFIVSDPESGIAALLSDKTDQTVTGSPIEKCDLLGLLTVET